MSSRVPELRRILRRELARLDVAELAVYVHGTPAVVRLSDRRRGEQVTQPARIALAALRSLPDRCGARAVLDALEGGGE